TAADDIVQPAEPTKAADERWVYEFAGWTPPLAEVTTNATYGATYRAEVRKYDVTFVWHGGEASATYPYGTEAGDVAVPDDPPDYVENGMIHTFAGWSPAEVADVTGEVTYTATYDEAAAIARIVGGAYYPSLAQAIVAAESGATVVLLADDEVSFAEGGVVIDKDLVIDGAGFTVKGVSNANIHNVTANATPPDVEFDGVDGTNVQGFFVKGGDLAFTNLVFSEFGDTDYVNKFGYTPIQTASAYEGRLVIADVNFEKFNRTAICIRGGTFSIAGVNIDANAENRDVLAQGKDHFQQPIEIRGGTGTIDGVAISGGDVYGSNGGGAIVAWSDVTVRNVDIDFTGVGIWADYANIAVEGEDTSVAATGKALFVEDGGSITVAAGDFSGELAVDAVEGSAIAVNGGTFDAPVPAEFAGAGLLPTTLPDANGKYTVAAARTVTFDSNGGTPVEAAAVAHGEPVAAPDPAPEREHYTFRAWQLAGSDYDFAAPVTADIDLVADWTPDRFTVTFVDEDGVTVLKKATEYDYGTPAADIAKPADPAKAGDAQYSHPFTGWSPEIADVTADATYRATYGTSLNQYTVKFVGDLGEVISSARYDYGTPASAIVVPPDPEKATAQYVYTFQGWAPAFAAVTGNAAYMATYTGVAYHPERELQVLTFDSIGGVCPISTLTCEVGGKYGPLPRPVWSPNVFLGWFTEPEGGVQKTKNSTVTKAAERTFYAHWKKRQAVTFDANGGTCWAATRIYDAGVAYGELPIPKRDGKAFLGWFTAATGGEAVTVESIVPDVGARTLWAHWSGEQTVAFEAGGGTCDPATKTVELGEKYGPLPTPVWPPNVFLGWFTAEEGGSRVTANTTVGKEAAKTLWAHWRKRQVATFEANGGTCWAATRIYDAGAPYGELPVPKRDGQGFLGWFTAEVDGEPVTVESIVPDIGARTLWAHWTTEQTVTFDANGGTCDPAEKTVAIGGKYGPLPTPAWNGHKFLGWFTAAEEGSRVTANTTVWTVAGKTLWAHWNETAGSLSITGFAVKRPAGPAARDARGQAVGVLSFEAEAGRVYELQWTTVLGGEWTAGRRWTAETDGETSVEVPATPGETTGFYRLAAPAE
ncbi:MAG: InlB B-repeat-containing protein, partial [Kiritimatiellae bacterium]|nr:InlB B-repeat-containing protein [Kiritimatiellia bacterium]